MNVYTIRLGQTTFTRNAIFGRTEKMLVFALNEANARYIAHYFYPDMTINALEIGQKLSELPNLMPCIQGHVGSEGYVKFGETELEFIPVDTRTPKINNMLTPP